MGGCSIGKEDGRNLTLEDYKGERRFCARVLPGGPLSSSASGRFKEASKGEKGGRGREEATTHGIKCRRINRGKKTLDTLPSRKLERIKLRLGSHHLALKQQVIKN